MGRGYNIFVQSTCDLLKLLGRHYWLKSILLTENILSNSAACLSQTLNRVLIYRRMAACCYLLFLIGTDTGGSKGKGTCLQVPDSFDSPKHHAFIYFESRCLSVPFQPRSLVSMFILDSCWGCYAQWPLLPFMNRFLWIHLWHRFRSVLEFSLAQSVVIIVQLCGKELNRASDFQYA